MKASCLLIVDVGRCFGEREAPPNPGKASGHSQLLLLSRMPLTCPVRAGPSACVWPSPCVSEPARLSKGTVTHRINLFGFLFRFNIRANTQKFRTDR